MSETKLRDLPVIKTFLYEKKYYFYDTYTNHLLNITQDIYLEICKLNKIGINEYKKLNYGYKAYKDVISLLDKGFFRYDFIKEIEHPYTNNIKFMLDRCVNQIVLEVTSVCNFKCRYCHQPNNQLFESKTMSEEIAYKSVDYLYDHAKDASDIAVTFYGGEPLLNFRLIKLVVLYTNKKFQSKSILYNMTINASLLNDDIIAFLVENNFSLLISLDGNSYIQNYHRKYLHDGGDTFNIVWNNIMKIKNEYPEYFKTNVSFNSVVFPNENQNDVITFFESNNIPKNKVKITPADLEGIDYNPNAINVMDVDSVSDFEENYKDMIKKLSEKKPLFNKWHHNGPCAAGAMRLFVSTDGHFYPCEKVEHASPCQIGTISTGVDLQKVLKIINIGKLTQNECKSCWAMRFCTLCVKKCIDGKNISCDKKKISCEVMKNETLHFFTEYIKNNYTTRK